MQIAAGILTLFMGGAHLVYGEKVQLPRLSRNICDTLSAASARVMVYQGGVLLILTGLLQFLSGVGTVALVGFAEYIPVAVIGANLITFLVIAACKHNELFSITVPQLIIFTVIIVLQVLAILNAA